MGNRAHQVRHNGWRETFDPDLWRQFLAAGMAGAVCMGALACTITLARDTDGHDWYAAAKLTAAELLIAVGFDENALTEYRTADGTIETVSRYELTVTLQARWAREDILAAAWDGATLGALCGLGGSLLSLVLSRRSRYDLRVRRAASGSAAQDPHERRERVVLEQQKPLAAAIARPSGPPRSVTAELAQTPVASEPGPASPEPGNTEPSAGSDPTRGGRKDRTLPPAGQDGGTIARKRPKRPRPCEDVDWF